jgi:hypothetical protein
MDLTLTTPSLLFPAVSLILVAYSSRFQAAAAVIRDLYDRYRTEREPHLVDQIERLQRRIVLIRNMQITAILSNFGCVADMFLIYFGLQTAAQWLLGTSMVLLLVSMGLALVETGASGAALKLQLEDLDRRPDRNKG